MNRLELIILCAGIVFFSALVLGVAVYLSANQAVYTLFAGILGNFSGGLMVYMNLKQPPGGPPGGAPA